MNAFEFSNVSFAYPCHPIFTNLNLAIESGDFVAVVGGNGAGKSTFLKLCVGALSPDAGEIRIHGDLLQSFQNWHKIGYVPQNPLRDRAFPITVSEVISMGRIPGLPFGRSLNAADREAIQKAIVLTGVEGFQHKLIGNLSGGQQQRVMVARALAAAPETLILDEPTAGIDAKGSQEFYELLQKLNHTSHITILLVTHDLDKVAPYASKVLRFDEGLKYYGSAEPFRLKAAPTLQEKDVLYVRNS